MKKLSLLQHKKTKEIYCCYELSKLLKQAGFNYECDNCFDNKILKTSIGFINTQYDDRIACPTIYAAQTWLLEEKHLPIQMFYSFVKDEWASYVDEKYYWGKNHECVLAEGILQHLKKLLCLNELDITFI